MWHKLKSIALGKPPEGADPWKGGKYYLHNIYHRLLINFNLNFLVDIFELINWVKINNDKCKLYHIQKESSTLDTALFYLSHFEIYYLKYRQNI